MKTVLYLNGKVAVWVCFEGNRCLDVYAEPLHTNASDYQPCEWLGKQPQLVHLVIDSERAAIDAHPLQRTGSLISQHSIEKGLRKSLVNRFPEAVIQTPFKHVKINAMLVQELNLTEAVRGWLDYVEKSNVTFCSIATSAELEATLFSVSGNNTPSAFSTEFMKGDTQPYLVLSKVLGFYKHTFCRSGYAIFTRSIENTGSVSHNNVLKETIAHLHNTDLIDSAVTVCAIGFSDKQLAEVSALEGVDKLLQLVNDAYACVNVNSVIDNDTYKYHCVIRCARQALKQSSKRQRHSLRYSSFSLPKYKQLVRHRNNVRQLSALAVLAVCSACYSGVEEWQKQQRLSGYKQAQEHLSMSSERTRRAIREESSDGLVLADVLRHTAMLKSSVSAKPVDLLSIVATVFTERRELALQELSWVCIDEDRSVAESGLAVMAAQGISTREIMPTQNTKPSRLLVNVIGHSNVEATLRDQQGAFNDLIAGFEQYASIADLTVLEAPLAHGANNDRIGANVLNHDKSFRIQFHFDWNSADEA